MNTMMAACGVMCSGCPAYHGAAKDPAHQCSTVAAWRRIYDLTETPEHITCGGCLGPDDEVFHTSVRCKARRCCRSKGFSSCAECTVERCGDLEKAQAVWDEVPELASSLSASDFEIYARPYCGHRERLAGLRATGRGGVQRGRAG